MTGSLAQRAPCDLLTEIRLRQASGILRLQSPEGTRQIFIDAGVTIRFAASTLPSESITALFQEKGGVKDEQLRQATAAKQGEELLGTVLVRLGVLTRATLAALTHEHIRRVLRGALGQRGGSWEFQQGALPFREQLDAGLTCAEILLDWCRSFSDIDWIRRRLGDPEARVEAARRPPAGYQQVPLSPAEGFTMSRVDGRATLQEICMLSPMGEETALRALLGLGLAGIIEMPPTAAELPLPGGAPPVAAARVPPNGGAPGPAAAVAPARPAPAAPAAAPRAAAPRPGAPGAAPRPGAATPGRPAAPKPPLRPAPRKVTPITTRPPAGADLEREMLERFERMQDQNLYQVLSTQSSASADDVRRAYYVLAKKFHPDKFTKEDLKAKAEKVFGHITEAYSTLSHEETRRKYDEDLAMRSSARSTEKAVDGLELARVNFRHGKDHFEKGRVGEAIPFFQNACDQDPSKAEHFHHLALAQSRNPRWKKDAEENFLKAIAIDPTHAESYAALGALYARGGVHSKAREMFRKALEWDPVNEIAAAGLADEEGAKKGLLGMFKK